MAGRDSLGGALDDIIRIGMNNQRLNLEKQRIDENNKLQQERIDNQRTFQQAQLMLSKMRLAQMAQGNALKQQELAERMQEFQVAQQNSFQKYATAEQKNLQAALKIAQDAGAVTANGNVDFSKMTPIQQTQYTDLMGAAGKGANTAYGLNQVQKATQLQTTLNSVDINPAIYYSGTEGHIRFLKDKGLAAEGKAPPMYNAYQTLLQTELPAMTDQLTKYWGASITPTAQSEMQSMLIPSNQWTNPNTADIVSQSYGFMKDLINAETANSMAAINNPSFYGSQSILNTPEMPTNSYNTNNYTYSNIVPSAKYNETQPDVIEAANKAGITPSKMAEIMNGAR